MASTAAESRLHDLTNLPVTCSSKDALVNFNRGIEAYVSLKESPSPWFLAALDIDEDLVIAHCLLGYFLLFSLHPPNDPQVSKHLEAVNRLEATSLHERELAYRRSLNTYVSNDLQEAANILEAMLVTYPTDAAGVHLLVRSYIMLGEFERLRDTMAWVLSFWKEEEALYPYLLSFYALEECNQREKAEVLARRALDLNVGTPFAYHAMAHVMEEEKEAEESVKLFTSTKEHWLSSVYGVHLTWHLCLYYLDLGDVDSILREFDSVIREKVSPDVIYGMLDGASLLWRLMLAGIDPGEERWEKVTSAVTKHVHNHQSAWFSAHIAMCLARGNVSESAARMKLIDTMLQSIQSYVEEEGGVVSRKRVYEKFGIPVCNALVAYGKGKYDEVLQIMLPIRHDLVRVGGSWAQRQIFNVTMIEAALKSNNIPTALGLVAELHARKPKNKMLQTLFNKLKEKYQENKHYLTKD